MVRCSTPATVHVISVLTDKRPFFTDSKLFPLVQLVMRRDVRFQHNPLERVFTVLPYRGVEDTVVIIITGGSQVSPSAFCQPGGRLADVSLFCDGIPNTVYYPVHNLFNVEFQRHDITVRGEILGRVRHGNPRYPHTGIGIFIVNEAVQPQKNFFGEQIRVVIIG